MNQWQKMIVNLKEKGLTQKQIADAMECSQNYVSNLENGLCGKRLGYDKGEKLKNFWLEHCSTTQVA
ncbi:transcriptional regulator [Acinetobacter sp. ANC 4558]|uniref:helix-turn-helix domain-containing protein n=1 Tax=Acinetobacter sp. ANC 4558 TaxID=1977876 RepID=UPI000A348493|nr:helix-turn-helix transcriptional regulator [Acinetobacter sp. ANC 4558]OTG81829.1 transcriptional regulator [Acinetobacter sp. ANC 4558]